MNMQKPSFFISSSLVFFCLATTSLADNITIHNNTDNIIRVTSDAMQLDINTNQSASWSGGTDNTHVSYVMKDGKTQMNVPLISDPTNQNIGVTGQCHQVCFVTRIGEYWNCTKHILNVALEPSNLLKLSSAL